ncbi:MAG TPA: DUF190 domain-containing protein [Paludibaculum sp.]|jgi:hypothetical protein
MKLLLIFLSETDTHRELPLYEALVRKLNSRGVSGATVHRGVMGFGQGHHVHRDRLFGVSDDRPITILAADTEERLRAALPGLRELAPKIPMLLVDVESL